jgi:hypothetical protein
MLASEAAWTVVGVRSAVTCLNGSQSGNTQSMAEDTVEAEKTAARGARAGDGDLTRSRDGAAAGVQDVQKARELGDGDARSRRLTTRSRPAAGST